MLSIFTKRLSQSDSNRIEMRKRRLKSLSIGDTIADPITILPHSQRGRTGRHRHKLKR